MWESVCSDLAQAAVESRVILEDMSSPLVIYADRATIKMVLTNLVGNAIEAMEQSSEERPKRVACVALEEASPGYRRISVRDTGPGVNGEVVSKLFTEIGVSTKAAGTGFQLYFCAQKLRQCGGRIEYDPDWRQGASFVVTLPEREGTESRGWA